MKTEKKTYIQPMMIVAKADMDTCILNGSGSDTPSVKTFRGARASEDDEMM